METAAYADRDVTVGELKLHYQEWGDASLPPMVLLHGFGVSGHMFDEFGNLARGRYRMFGIDQRGHGDSDWSESGDYSREAFVADLEGVRAALGLERFVLVGHSMGGLNAVVYAVQYPQHVTSLVLVDVGPEAAKEGVDNIVRFTRGPDHLEFDQYVEMAHRFNPRRSVENIRERMRHRLRPAGDGTWTWKFDRRFRDPESGIRVGSPLSSEDLWDLFRRVEVPTLLVRGAESDVLSQEVAERVVGEMRHARLVVIPGAGHSVPGDSPEAFTAAVMEFLEEGASEPGAALPARSPASSDPWATWQGDEPAAPTEEPDVTTRDQVPEPVGTPVADMAAAWSSASGPDAADDGRSTGPATHLPAQDALRTALETNRVEGAPAVPAAPRGRRGPGILVVAGGLALAAAAALLGARTLSRRRGGLGRRTARQAREARYSAEREVAEARARAISLLDDLTALGRERLEQVRLAELRAGDTARGLVDTMSEPIRRGGRRRRGKKDGGGRALRIAGRGVRAAGGLAIREARRGRRSG